MPEEQEQIRNRGCKCGWPEDSCYPGMNPSLKEGEDCPKVKHEREVERMKSKRGLEAKARQAARDAAFYDRTAGLIQIQEK